MPNDEEVVAFAEQADQNTLDTEHDSWLLVFLGLTPDSQQLRDGVPASFCESWARCRSYCARQLES